MAKKKTAKKKTGKAAKTPSRKPAKPAKPELETVKAELLPAERKQIRYTKELGEKLARTYVGLNGNKSLAARACGVPIRTMEFWITDNPHFERLFNEAENLLIDTVESALVQSAREKTVPSMIFFLKNRRPDKWRETANLTIENAETIAEEVRKLVES